MRHNTLVYEVESTGKTHWLGLDFKHGKTWADTIKKADEMVSKKVGEPCKVLILNGNAR